MTIVPLGINIDTSTAVDGARNLDALVPAAERVERASDKMVAAILADLKAVNEQGFKRLSENAEQSLVALNKLGQAKPTQNLPTEADRAAAAFDRLKASIDPVFKAELQLAQAQKTVDAALKSGKINAEQAAIAMRQYDAAVAAAGNGIGENQSFAGKVQNASFQLGDFAVQVGAGTSASVALAQQLPQLLGGFGVLGAVMGAVVAIGVPVASALFSIGGGAKDLDDRLGDLENSLRAVEDAMSLTGGTDALIERYGKATAEVRNLATALAETALTNARTAANDLVSGQWSRFSDNSDLVAPGGFGSISIDVSGLEDSNYGIEKLRATLSLTKDEARELQDLMIDTRSAQNAEDQANAFARVRDYLDGVRDAYGNIRPEAEAMSQEAERVEDLLRQAAGRSGELEAGMSGATAQIGAAGAAATAVANEIARAVGNLMSLTANAETALKQAQIRSQFRGDPVGEAGARASLDFDTAAGDLSGADPILRNEMQRQRDEMIADARETARLQKELSDWNKAQSEANRKGRGKSDAEKEADKAKREIERQREAQKKVEEGLERERDLLGAGEITRRAYNEAMKAGVDLYSEAGQKIAWEVIQLEGAKAEMDRIAETNEFVAQSFADMFTGAITGANSLKESIAGLIGQLGQMMVNKAFMSMLGGSGFGASAGGQFLGGLLSFDGGGYTGNGPRSGGLDGKGGFLAMMHPRETVSDHTKGQSASGAPASITVDVRGATGNAEVRQMVREGMAAAIRQAGANVPVILAQHQKRAG